MCAHGYVHETECMCLCDRSLIFVSDLSPFTSIVFICFFFESVAVVHCHNLRCDYHVCLSFAVMCSGRSSGMTMSVGRCFV